jgi:hypothetical protein
MVKHDILVRGVDLTGTENKKPVLLQMNDDDFPARFMQDLSSPGKPPISSAAVVDGNRLPVPEAVFELGKRRHGIQPQYATLYQPVQRILHVAMADLKCNTLMYPRVDPTRVLSAGLVVRRCLRQPGANGTAYDDTNMLSAWMRDSTGRFQWVLLSKDKENLDPDPTKRPQLTSGQVALDAQLAQLALSTAYTETTSPAFAAPPATCSAINRTVIYAVVPTASSEVTDTPPASPPSVNSSDLLSALPSYLRSAQNLPTPPIPPASGLTIDYHWVSDDFLNSVFPPTPSSESGKPPTPNSQVAPFQDFSLAVRMLHTVFGAFDVANNGKILAILNRHNVTFQDGSTEAMGDFYQTAKSALLYDGSNPPAPTQLMPTAWDWLNDSDQTDLLNALMSALTPKSQNLLGPQGRFQDSTRLYRLRFFFRIKSETPGCPPELVWSHYTDPFRLAAWHEGGQRTYPPIPLPDPASLRNAKPNCAFQVPGSLMGAMQGATISGLMNGGGGGSGLSLDWICGFNVPLITICAFFVLNIFLSLLNIVFFWLAFIKICIPFPQPSSSNPDSGAP